MFRNTPLAAAVLVAFATPLYAQTTTTPATGAQPASSASASPSAANQAADSATLPAVKVTGQSATPAEFAADVSSIGAKVPTALRNVPGITIGAAEGGQIGNNIYLDGFRDRGQYYRDTFNLESIDVLYGPSSLYFGRGSTGGVINQVSKQPTLKPRADVSVQAGTHDRYRTTVDLDTPITSTSAFRINAFGQDLGSSRDVMKSKDYGIAPEVKFGIGTPTEITLSALIQHNRDQPDYGVPALNGHPAPVNRGTFYGFTDDRTIQDVQTLNARIEHRFNDSLKLRNQTQFSHYSTEARATNAASVLTGPLPTSTALTNGNYTSIDPSKLVVKLQGKDRNVNDHSVYNSTDIEAKFNTGFIKHEVVAGVVDLSHETYSNQSFATTTPGLPSNTIAIVPLVDPSYTTRPSNAKTVATNLAESSANGIGVYANDTVSIGEPGRWWAACAGTATRRRFTTRSIRPRTPRRRTTSRACAAA
ncbi:MAG: Ferrichrome-iron receptor [uncultured Paraburkholderia sp.]|nr:MAG: Ferrichrome-iron receptor [uncultured Paraburkholderia sp.]CAH2910454.1 MAG: Ferrichrome-iron receptor [uncultured Paraburkholderia sp.]